VATGQRGYALAVRWRLTTAAVIVCAAVAGCGGGAHRHAATPPQAGAVLAGVPVSFGGTYRWLVRTTGAQPSVADENRFPGTTAWRLPGPAGEIGGVAHGNVVGYVSRQAVRVGQTERIYVRAAGARTVRIRIFRMGWYGGRGGREVLVSAPLRLRAQPPCTHRFTTGLTECAWHPTLSFVVPSALPTGVYIAKLSARTGERDCLFVVLAVRPQPLLAQLPTATYEAYNAWGGDSLYPGGADRVGVTRTTQGVEVSYERPYDSITGAGEFFARDVAMVRFLERYGYPVSYTTTESVDADPGQLSGHRALIDFGHSEYWSERQALAFARARNSGTNLLFLGSDTMAWRIRYARASHAATDAGAPDLTIVAYKEYAALDRDRSNQTGVFEDRGASLTGSAYLGCITPRLRQPGPPTYRYYAWVAGPSLRPAWLLAHTRMTAWTLIPGIVGYELDARTALSPAGTEVVGGGAALCMRPERGEPSPPAGEDLAQTTLYTARSGALVFNAGTLGWELGLEPVPSASPNAPRAPNPYLVAITRNLLAHVLAARHTAG
jgi:N,N-dimethylformamidase beta subunit-like, C-terminal